MTLPLAAPHRRSNVALDHEILLLLYTSEGQDLGLAERRLLDAPLPELVLLRRRLDEGGNPYPTLKRSLERLKSNKLCRFEGGKWHSSLVHPIGVLAYFASCDASGCRTDHFKDLVFSDAMFRYSEKGGWGLPLVHLLARLIVYEGSRLAPTLDKELDRWLTDVQNNALNHGVSDHNLPAFKDYVRARVSDLRRVLKQDSLEERAVAIEQLLRNDPNLAATLFLSKRDFEKEVRLSALASPRFWRQVLTTDPIRDDDFAPVVYAAPLVGTLRKREVKDAEGKIMEYLTFGRWVGEGLGGLLTIWLIRDQAEDGRVDSRLADAGFRLVFTKEGSAMQARLERLPSQGSN